MQKPEIKEIKKEARKIVWINDNAYVNLPADYIRANKMKRGDWVLIRYQGKRLQIDAIEDVALVSAVEKAVSD